MIRRAWLWLVDLVKNGPTWDDGRPELSECSYCGGMVRHGCDWCEKKPHS